MLHFIFGRAGFGKTTKIQEIVKECLQRNLKKIMLIVPEQSSFDTEKNILNLFGPQIAAKIQVTTFTRLVDLISRQDGRLLGKKINNIDRNLLMSLAIDKVADKLELYSGQVGKTEFIEIMVSALSEFKMCNITCSALLNAPLKEDLILKKKIYETTQILESYESLLKDAYIDPLDDLTRLANQICKLGFFYDYTVLLDGFDGFTAQQFSIIEIILKQSKNFYIALCTDEKSLLHDKLNLFSGVNRTVNKILKIAQKNNIKIGNTIYLKSPQRFKSEGLKNLESQFFCSKKQGLTQKIDDVFIFNGNTKYSEADFICRTIKRNICKSNYKYSDFAVVTRNDETYKGILDVAFEKYEIPYFMDRREDIDSKPLMQLVLAVLEIINGNFCAESIFKYLKTGLSGFSMDEISELENYSLFWNVTGERWLHNFTSNPDGYSQMNNKSEEKLLKINNLRKKFITPFIKLKKKLINSNGVFITKSLYEFLEEIKIRENLKLFGENLERCGQKNLSAEQVRLWNLLMEIFDKMANILKDKKISIKNYARLLKLAIKSSDISFIPHGIDEVVFGSIDRIRLAEVKFVFIIGAVEAEFPRVPVATGIFSDDQRKKLISLGFPLYDSIEGLAINERFLVYKAITLPSEKLYITWSSTTTFGGKKSASSIIKETKAILPKVECLDEYSFNLENEIWTIKQAFEVCAKHWNDNSRFSQTLKEYFSNLSDNLSYGKKIKSIEKATLNSPFKIDDEKKSCELFGNDIRISASQIEKFYLCKFAYFCRYGLLAKDRKKAKFDALQYGNLIHFVFENILKYYKAEEILNFSEKKLLSVVKIILNGYIENNLGGWTDKSARLKYLLKRVANAALPLVNHMAEEISQSEFSPIAFELDLSNNDKFSPLRLKLSDGTNIFINGKIDRVDLMEKDGKTYFRVIDYKTGHKDFYLSDILYGLNLQMLLYLEALCSNLTKKYKKAIPAGFFYFPSVSTVLNLDRFESLEKLKNEKLKKLRMKGLILNDNAVILGMEPDGKGLYIPVKMENNKPKSYNALLDENQLKDVMAYIKKLIEFMGTSLHSGDITAEPTKGAYDACEFCEYKTVCVSQKNETIRKVERLEKEDFLKKLKSVENAGDLDEQK